MATEIRVPALGESITEAIVGKWFKKAGDAVKADEPLVELETDKVTVEVPAPVSGVLGEIKVVEGQTVAVGALLGAISNGGAAARRRPRSRQQPRRRLHRLPPSRRLPARKPRATARCRPAPRRARSSRKRASMRRRCRLRQARSDPQGGCAGGKAESARA